MLKRFLCILMFLGVLPAFSGEFEEASKTNRKIFLYMYTKNCSYCVKFNPIYEKVSQKYGGNCKFLKINADTEYGYSLMRGLNAYYVPYVAMVDNNKKVLKTINPTCMLNYGCALDAVDRFVK